MPGGLLVTVPLPEPAIFTFNRYSAGWKVAVAVWSPLTVRVQVPWPLHGPDQPVNTDPGDGVAVRVTVVPSV